jgi:hypothetical protein
MAEAIKKSLKKRLTQAFMDFQNDQNKDKNVSSKELKLIEMFADMREDEV